MRAPTEHPTTPVAQAAGTVSPGRPPSRSLRLRPG